MKSWPTLKSVVCKDGDEWKDRTYTVSNAENYFETFSMCIIAGYGIYVLHKLIFRRHFWDFFAITIPLMIVIYASMTFWLYWTNQWLDLD